MYAGISAANQKSSSVHKKRDEKNKSASGKERKPVNQKAEELSQIFSSINVPSVQKPFLISDPKPQSENLSQLVLTSSIQPKLNIDQPGDVYEQEADRVADQVMNMPELGIRPRDNWRQVNNPFNSSSRVTAQSEATQKNILQPSLDSDSSESATAFPPNRAESPVASENAPQAQPDTETQEGSGKFIAFTRSSASNIAKSFPGFGERFAKQLSQDRAQFNATAPPLRVVVPGKAGEPSKTTEGPRVPAAIPTGAKMLLDAPSDVKSAEPRHDETKVPAQPGGQAISTSAGDTPRFQAVGEASPQRTRQALNSASGQARRPHRAVAAQIAADRSAEKIQPVAVDQAEPLAVDNVQASIPSASSQEMAEYAFKDIPEGVRRVADQDFTPLLDQTLAEPRRQVGAATAERDQKKRQAILEGQAEADQAGTEARVQQDAAIQQGRQQVEQAKRDGLAEGQAEIEKFEQDAGQQYQEARTDIQTHIDAEQQRANDAVADGEQQARVRQAQADWEADEARREGDRQKRKKKKKNWLGKIVGYIVEIPKRVLNWFKDRLNEIFEAAKKKVREILEGAKKVAVGIIKGLRTAVAGMIKTFAGGLKTMVDLFLAFLPSLRDRVNAAIDDAVTNAVEVVDRIAKTLEDKVVALVDKVSAIINKVIEVFETAVIAAIAVTQALLSGDFKEAAKILFLAACKTLGIPGEELLDILADAGGALMDIIKKPAAFLGNLLKSVKLGFGTFMTNFKDRFVQGLTGWLFGNLAQGGIQLPKKLDLKSIFMLIGQVLGFTYEFVRARVTRKVGEKRTGMLEKVTTQVKIIFTEGPGAVWDWIKDQASKVKEMVVETVSQWLITQLVVKAATKLATMFNPVGAFVQAILMMYNTIMFFVERIKEIMSLVKAITSSFKQMAKGAISAAAAWIDQSMSKAIPLIIAFLARLVGLGGLGAKIRQIVTKLRAPVSRAIDFVVDKIISGAKKVWGGVKAGTNKLINWWETRTIFNDSLGKEHSLFYSGRKSQAVLTMASDKKPVKDVISEHKRTKPVSSKVETAESIRQDIKRVEETPAKSETEREAKAKEIKALMPKLAQCLSSMAAPEPDRADTKAQSEYLKRTAAACGISLEQFMECCRNEDPETMELLIDIGADISVGRARAAAKLITGEDPVNQEKVDRWGTVVEVVVGAVAAKMLLRVFEKIRVFLKNVNVSSKGSKNVGIPSEKEGAEKASKSALDIAKSGGKHAGQLKQFLKQTPEQLQKTIKSFDKQIAKHQGWIKDPASKVKNFNSLRPEHQQNLIHHWNQDIIRHNELKSIAESVLKGL